MEFEPFGKIPRLNREIVVTEKLDGTNAAVIFQEIGEDEYDPTWAGPDGYPDDLFVWYDPSGPSKLFRVGAQSRKRLIYPNSETQKGVDNYGFAGWVYANAQKLLHLLGPGRHFGEWWGQGIQGRYGQHPRTFSLFNVQRYAGVDREVGGVVVNTVPELYRGEFSQDAIDTAVRFLREGGSIAAPGESAEGVIVLHTAAGHLYKVTCENDERPKEIVVLEQAQLAIQPAASIHWGGDGV